MRYAIDITVRATNDGGYDLWDTSTTRVPVATSDLETLTNGVEALAIMFEEYMQENCHPDTITPRYPKETEQP